MNRDEFYLSLQANREYVLAHSDELYHHGIHGQKWGVRRFQNPDGTLTEEGKRRYGKAVKETIKSKRYNDMKEARETLNPAFKTVNKVGGGVSGALNGAVVGAVAGGPIGAAIGGITGTGLGVAMGIFKAWAGKTIDTAIYSGMSNRAKKKADAIIKELEDTRMADIDNVVTPEERHQAS